MSCLNKFGVDGERQELLAKFADQMLDFGPLLIIAESHSLTMATSTSRTADSMQVALRLSRETEVEDSFDR